MKKIKEFLKDFERRINWKVVIILYVVSTLIIIFDNDYNDWTQWIIMTICVIALVNYDQNLIKQQQQLYEIEDSTTFNTFLKKHKSYFTNLEEDNLPGKWQFREFHYNDELIGIR